MNGPDLLLTSQNADGGWAYGAGSSWTEPTVYALLALAAAGITGDPIARGAAWLRARQRHDGGWGPHATVNQSTWVTALLLLLPDALVPGIDRRRAVEWLLGQTGRESGLVYRLRLWMLGIRVQESLAFDGWPWYPETAAWVVPTAISLLAMQKIPGASGDSRVSERLAQGHAFLLARRCRDGGWNHGSTKALGYDSDSYPETTGVALLALHGVQFPEVAACIAVAERHLATCGSAAAASWLTMALLAHGRRPTAPALPIRDGMTDLALAALADAALRGRNLFLE